MTGADYYSLTALPALDLPGAAPPLSLSELLRQIPPGRAHVLVRTVLLAEDLLQREAFHAGELAAPQPAVLTPEQARGEAPLPPELEPPPSDGPARALPADVVWESYYGHAAAIAHTMRSPFLQEWVAMEVRLRNELARVRAHALGLQAAPYLVATAVQGGAADVEAALNAWLDAPDPLTGLRALISARWRWIEQHEPLYTFAADEYAVYAARLALLHRWRRTATERARWRSPPGGTPT